MGGIENQLREQDLVRTFVDLTSISTCFCFQHSLHTHQETTHLYHPLKHGNVLNPNRAFQYGYLSSSKVVYLHKGGPELLWIEDVVESATSGLSHVKWRG
jgi:hypothetical protein